MAVIKLSKSGYKYFGNCSASPNYYQSTNKKGRGLSQSAWQDGLVVDGTRTQLLIYGGPWKYEKGMYRYLGYTIDDLGVTNITFPFDDTDFSIVDNLNWITAPWDDGKVQQVVLNTEGILLQENHFDSMYIFRESAYKGLSVERNNGKTIIGSNAKNMAWEQYMHVYMPPTEYNWGMGRMWYMKGGYPYYKTVLMPPFSFYRTPIAPPKGEVPGFKGELGGGGGFR